MKYYTQWAGMHLACLQNNMHLIQEIVQRNLRWKTLQHSNGKFKNWVFHMIGSVKSVQQIHIIISGHNGFLRSRSEEHTSELQSRGQLVCRLLLEKTKHTQ